MFLIVGLGNFGQEYALTRHNVGFMAADIIARRFSFPEFKTNHQGLVSTTLIGKEKAMLVKPLTYMNLSGNCIGEITSFYKIPTEKILVFHDDLDLPLCSVKIKYGGGNAGHNGLKSLDSHIGKNYWRVRIGIDKPIDKNAIVNYVTMPFTKKNLQEMDFLLNNLAEKLDIFIEQGGEAYRSQIGGGNGL